MKKAKENLEDDLCPEYDFHSLRVIASGPGRRKPTEPTIALAPDVAQVFPDSDSVNEALRFLMRIIEKEMACQ